MTLQTKHIQAYDLATFCQDVQQAFSEGFTFDFTRNEHWPTSFGAFYSATLVQKVVKAAANLSESVVSRAIDTAEVQGKFMKEAAVEALEELAETVDATATKSAGRPKKG